MSGYEICRGASGDMDEIVDFANYVFSQSSRPHDFRRLIPKLYAEGRDTADRHWLAKEHGRIRAMVCALPVTFMAQGVPLKAAGVGTVAVHPYDRGKGYMKELMGRMLTDLDDEGVAFSFLGGMRQRYEYFGYTPAGSAVTFSLSRTNLRHRYGKAPGGGVEFVPLTDAADLPAREAFALYAAQPLNGARPRADFCTIGQTWNAELFAVRVGGGFAGYAAVSGGAVQELQVSDAACLPVVMQALLDRQGVETLHISLPLWEREKIRWLSDVAESGTVGVNQMFRIRDWAAVTRAFLRCKAGYAPLVPGRLVLDIGGVCRLDIQAADREISVEETRADADVALAPLEAARFLFSPLGCAEDRGAPSGWLPLPLFVPSPDGC